MDLSCPITSVIPSAHGPVLAALARAGMALSGRQVAALVEGRVSRSRVNSVLGELAASGLVLAEPAPPSVRYRLNREHVAAGAVAALADLRGLLLDRIREAVEAWQRPALAVWLFGSAARGDGSPGSDIDLLLVLPDGLSTDDRVWIPQVAALAESVLVWSGNPCQVLELTKAELTGSGANPRLVAELRRDAILIAGASPPSLLGPAALAPGA